ncbi:hypothetical protein ACFU53_31745 [Streptomyces sp. NPDC057474]|uniref:hypothetical protein n=1 Tax=Streptomyces sp. NPDC057474 TaxID=3346144 RepID=UPI0036A9E333
MEQSLIAADLVVRRFSNKDLAQIRQPLIDVHADAYADAMDDEFNQRFPWFVDHWGGNPDLDCVIAFDSEEAVAFAYGAPSTAYREGWREQALPHRAETASSGSISRARATRFRSWIT